MDFSNERYVRLYVRDTVTWKRLGWDGRTVLMHLLRKADRAGVIDLGGIEPWEAPVVLCDAPEETARRGMARMLELGVVVHDADRLVFPRYLEANECAQSGAQRMRELRSREREQRATLRRNVTESDETYRDRDDLRRGVTDGDSVPCRAVPYKEESARPPVTKRHTSAELDHQIRVGFSNRLLKAAESIPNQRALGALARDLAPWVRETAELRKLAELDLVNRVLDGFFVCDHAKSKGYPPAFLGSNPLEYLERPRKPQLVAAGPKIPSGVPPIANFGPKPKEIA